MTRFDFNWKVTLFALGFGVVFTNLGLWQLDRESEKRTFLEQQETRRNAPPRSAGDLPETAQADGLGVRLSGEFDGEVALLLDNRVLDGTVGFELLQLFSDVSGSQFLVNRGFLPMGRTRDDLPDIPRLTGTVSIEARVYVPRGEAFVLAADTLRPEFPTIIQQVDITQLSEQLDIDIYPYMVRLAADQPGALPRYWPETVMLPAQHRGYAIQWFTMAVVVVLAWLAFSFRRRGTESR